MRTYIGIDPGKNGAIAVICEHVNGLSVFPIETTPTFGLQANKREYNIPAMAAILAAVNPQKTHVTIERVHVMPGEGVVSAYSMGRGEGIWLGILNALKLPYTQVHAVSWRASLLAGLPKAESPKQRKSQAAMVAAQLYPTVNLYGPKGGLLDGHADALLIAEYGRRTVT